MQKYINFGVGCNTPVTELVDEVHERYARHISRTIGTERMASVLAAIKNERTGKPTGKASAGGYPSDDHRAGRSPASP